MRLGVWSRAQNAMDSRSFTFPISVVFLAIAAAAGAAYALAARKRELRPEPSAAACRIWLFAMCGVYFVVMVVLSFVRYEHLLCGLYDLGIFDTVVWNLSRGRFLYDFRGPFDHVSPALVLAAPLYWIVPDARWLLLLQSLAMAAAAAPLYAFACTILRDRRAGLVFAAAYLLHPFTARVNLFDFHAAALHPLAFFCLCYCYARRRWLATFVAAAAALMVKEDAVMLVFGLGLFALADVKRRRMGAALLVMAVAWAVFCMTIYFPVLRGVEFRHYGRYPQILGGGLLDTARLTAAALVGPFTKPYVWRTLGLLLLPVALLPVARPWALVALVGAPLSVNLLSSYIGQQILRGHYSATAIAGTFAAAVYGLQHLRRTRPQVSACGLVAGLATCALLCNFFFGEPAFERYYENSTQYRPLKHLTLLSIPRQRPDPVLRWHQDVAAALARSTPKRLSVMAQNSLGYLFTQRAQLYEVQPALDADVYVFDHRSNMGHTAAGVYNDVLRRLAASDAYEPLLRAGGFECYARRGKGREVMSQACQQLERTPGNIALHYLLGAMSFTAHDFANTKLHLGFLANSNVVTRASVDTFWMLADAQARGGRVGRAIITLERGLALAPEFAPAHEAAATLCRTLGRTAARQRHERDAARLRAQGKAGGP